MDKLITDKLSDLIVLCKQYGIKSLHLFGSGNTNKFNAESDIDFLVSFRDDLSIEEYTDNYFSLHDQLHTLFNRKIDLVTENSLSNPYFIEGIEPTKQLIYGT